MEQERIEVDVLTEQRHSLLHNLNQSPGCRRQCRHGLCQRAAASLKGVLSMHSTEACQTVLPAWQSAGHETACMSMTSCLDVQFSTL